MKENVVQDAPKLQVRSEGDGRIALLVDNGENHCIVKMSPETALKLAMTLMEYAVRT